MNKSQLLVLLVFLFSNFAHCQTNDKPGIIEHNNLPYVKAELAEDERLQQLNLVLPQGINDFPLLIWIGGGAWSYGDRNQEMDFARKLGREGIAVASIGHRLSPAVWRDSTLKTGIQHPKHIEDVAASVKWLVENAGVFGYDIENLFIGGYSSGAHLAALLNLDSSYLHHVGLSPKIFKGIIPISGTYDVLDYHTVFLTGSRPELAELHVEAVFGSSKQALIDASPITYIKNLSAPMLVICDNNLYNYTKLFEERIRETEFRKVQVIYAYDLSHGALWKNLSFSEKSIYRDFIVDFIETHGKTG